MPDGHSHKMLRLEIPEIEEETHMLGIQRRDLEEMDQTSETCRAQAVEPVAGRVKILPSWEERKLWVRNGAIETEDGTRVGLIKPHTWY